jgi:aminoglycoside 3-N-acetyltransferase
MFNLIRRAWSGPVQPTDLDRALESLGLDGHSDVIAHSSLSSFGFVTGGARALVDAMLGASRTLVVPTFSYYTLVYPEDRDQPDWPRHRPEDGPPFRPDSPVSSDIGRVPQTVLDHIPHRRSGHPALSFAALGANADRILDAQTLDHPYAPIGALYDLDGDVLLMGVDHRSNTTVHYGEYLAGRPLLDRWANTVEGVVHTYFPNCSAAFNAIGPRLETLEQVQVGRAIVSRMKVREVVDVTVAMLEENPEALLCSYSNCRCQSVRERVRREGLKPRGDAFVPRRLEPRGA